MQMIPNKKLSNYTHELRNVLDEEIDVFLDNFGGVIDSVKLFRCETSIQM